jgi:hypothetical protein
MIEKYIINTPLINKQDVSKTIITKIGFGSENKKSGQIRTS